MEGCATGEDAFVAGLANNRAGRILSNHLSSVELRATCGGHDSAVSEAMGNERVFVHALGAAVYGHRPFPCALAMPLPRFLAILNLSGERMLVYSDSPALITKLCTRSSALPADELAKCVRVFETFPMARTPDCCKFVLLTYSMPWQSGTHSTFWHLSACCIEQGHEAGHGITTFVDRALSFSGVSVAPFAGKPVLDPRDKKIPLFRDGEHLELVSLKQIQDFEEAYSPTCLDVPVGYVSRTAPLALEGKNEHLFGIMQALTRERAKDQAEVKRLRARLQEESAKLEEVIEKCDQHGKKITASHAVELKKLRDEAGETLMLGKEQSSALNAEIVVERAAAQKTAAERKQERKVHEKVASRCDELRRQAEAKDKLHNAALREHRASIVQLEARLDSATSQASTLKARLDKEHTALLLRQQALHAESLERMAATLASKERIADQLSENNERLSAEKLSLASHDEEQAATIKRLETELSALTESSAAEAVVRTTSTSTSTCNASTATHHCASTQTLREAPAPAPAPVPAPEPAPAPAPARHITYQDAIDALQRLVNQCRPLPLPTAHANYAVPLPFPHFVPNGHHAPTQYR